MKDSFDKSDLKKRLTEEQYNSLVNQGTESPFSGKLFKNKDKGQYTCPICESVLFTSEHKYDSDTLGLEGWPSFSDVIEDNIVLKDDNTLGMKRIEVSCKTCGGHLGHLFDDKTSPSGKHYCINSSSLEFKPQK